VGAVFQTPLKTLKLPVSSRKVNAGCSQPIAWF
jgi:hypothetical protein